MENCNCIRAEEIQELKKVISKQGETLIEHTARIIKMESDKELSEYRHNEQMKILIEVQRDLKEMKDKPAKRWDIVVTGILTAIVGALGAIISGKIFN